MRKYTLTPDAFRTIEGAKMQQQVWDWVKSEGGPEIHSIMSIDLYPSKREVVYHLAAGIETGDDNTPYVKTMPFPMPLKNRPDWVDICTMSEV